MNKKLKIFFSSWESDPYEDQTDVVHPYLSAERERRNGADRFDLPRVEDHAPYVGAETVERILTKADAIGGVQLRGTAIVRVIAHHRGLLSDETSTL